MKPFADWQQSIPHYCEGQEEAKTSIDNLISQLFRGLQEFRYVGVITGFEPDSITTISCIGRQQKKCGIEMSVLDSEC
jgi:hypothetical protein